MLFDRTLEIDKVLLALRKDRGKITIEKTTKKMHLCDFCQILA